MTTKKIISIAKELLNNMAYKEFENGEKRMIVTAEFDSKIYNQIMDILHKVDADTTLSDDSRYIFTAEAFETIVDSDGKNMEDLEESIYSIEGDIYTSQLTTWLDESPYHVEYLTKRNGRIIPSERL